MNQSDASVLHPTRIDMPLEIRLSVLTLLQQTLACTVVLRSHVKQAFWNVKGEDFFPLQALFATIATELDGYTDLVADRSDESAVKQLVELLKNKGLESYL